MKIKKYQKPAGVLPSIQRYMVKQGILSLIPKNISIGVAGHAESATEGTSAFFNKDALKNIPKVGHEIINSINSKDDERYVNPGNLFLLDRNRQQKAMEKWGYRLVNDNDYGSVSKAVAKINNISNPIPIYQLGEDEIDPSKVKPLQGENGPIITMNRSSGYDAIRNNKSRMIDLPNANYYPQSWYKDENGTIYVRSYDLNDYGSRDKKWRKHMFNKIINLPTTISNKLFGKDYDTGDPYQYEDKMTYGNLQFLANIYDRIGNPFVQRSGIKKASQEDIDTFLNHPIYDEKHNVIGFSGNRIMQKYQGGVLKKYQQDGSIKYTPTNSNTELPEIEGYKPQFSNFWYRGDETKKEESVPVQEEHVQEESVQETPEVVEEAPVAPIKSEWSDIKAMIKHNEGFMARAKKVFNEPEYEIGHGFYNFLPDGRKITNGMVLTEQEADRQLDIAINNLRKNISSAISKYNMNLSDNRLNVLIDLGYHGGSGLVSKLLREANGDINKIPTLLSTYATTAKYGDTSIVKGLRDRAQRRVEGWNKD